MTGFTKLPSMLDEDIIADATRKALRKNIINEFRKDSQDATKADYHKKDGKADGRGRQSKSKDKRKK